MTAYPNVGFSNSPTPVPSQEVAVFGTPADGQIAVWNAATGRVEWGAAPSGGSAPDSFLVSTLAAAVTDITGFVPLAWVDPPADSEGSDISFAAGAEDVGQVIQFDTAGRYEMHCEFAVDAFACSGTLGVFIRLQSGTSRALAVLGNSFDMDFTSNDGYVANYDIPQFDITAGGQLQVFLGGGQVATGTPTLATWSALLVRRIA